MRGKRMNIKEYYQERCRQSNWYNKYFQCGDDGDGSIFKVFSTNYRDLSAFEYYFNEFKKLINIPRNTWKKKETTGQEVAKQYVVNMVESFLFISHRNSDGELVYSLSIRGQDFEKMLTSNFLNEEKKFLTLLYLINASFKKTPRYLLKQAYQVLDAWINAGFSENEIESKIKNFLIDQKENRKVENIFRYDIVWLLSFYSDEEFLKLYQASTVEELTDLKEQAVTSYNNSNKLNVLSWKFRSTNFSRPTLIDTFIIIYIASFIRNAQIEDYSYNEFYECLVKSYNQIYQIDTTKVLSYIFKNENVFKVIFKNAISEDDDFTERYIPEYKIRKNISIPTEKIDATSQEGVEKLEAVRAVLKKLAKDKSNYKCALYDINQCQYFTSKEEHKNYLEIHHLVPREFSYNFEDTIEFVENYVPLCPRCHRMIHKAEDRERIGLINYLFSQRHEELEKHNINVTLKELYEFYKIDKEN